MMQRIADFLLSGWLWSVTWGWYHIPINFLVLCFLLRWMMRLPIIHAVLLSFGAQLFSFFMYSGVLGVLLYKFNFSFDPAVVPLTIGSELLRACLRFGISYAILQSFFLLMISIWYRMNTRLAVCAAILSNILSALILSKFLQTVII